MNPFLKTMKGYQQRCFRTPQRVALKMHYLAYSDLDFQCATECDTSGFLNFTYEVNQKNKLPFLNVLVEFRKNTFTTSLCKKKNTNRNAFHLNFRSGCPLRYKNVLIKIS